MDKYQTYMLHSKTYTHNAGELTEICMEKGGMEFGVMMTKHYTKLVHSWLEENWNINDYLKEEVMKKLTASWFIEKIRKQAEP